MSDKESNSKTPEVSPNAKKSPEKELETDEPVPETRTMESVASEGVQGTAEGQELATPTDDTPATTGKRQRTLNDMFGRAGGVAVPAAKKMRGTSGASSTTAVATNTAAGGSRASGTVAALNSIAFSKSEFEASLDEEEGRLLKLECDMIGLSWLKILKDEIRKPYFLQLKRFLWKEGVTGAEADPKLKVYPTPSNIYTWSNTTPLGRVKCVIIGQDPYHGPGQAHGLCFSVPKGVPVPPSLRNIYTELKAEYPDFQPPKHGNLISWAEDGVLMLNTALTVRAGDAGSHAEKGWETFTSAVVDVVDKYGGANLGDKTGYGRGVVFLAWGSWAAKRVAKLDKKKHLILTSAHPSPFSARKGFLGNGHFKKANEWLESKYGPDGCVDWTSKL